jgi:hypothetical protein
VESLPVMALAETSPQSAVQRQATG